MKRPKKTNRRYLAAGALLAAGLAVASLELRPEPAPEETTTRTIEREEAPRYVPRDLRRVPKPFAELGIASANFVPQDWEEPLPAEELELSREQRELAEKMRSGSLSRIGQSTIFAAPGSASGKEQP